MQCISEQQQFNGYLGKDTIQIGCRHKLVQWNRRKKLLRRSQRRLSLTMQTTGRTGRRYAKQQISPLFLQHTQGDWQSPIDFPPEKDIIYEPALKMQPLHVPVKDGVLEFIQFTAMFEASLGPMKFNIKGTEFTYSGMQFHFHSPSEHTFQGKRYPLEMHIVHKMVAGPKDYQFDHAVIAVYFDDTDDVESDFIANLNPEKPGQPITKPVDVAAFLKPLTKLYHYQGSFTTPPCGEVINWYKGGLQKKIGRQWQSR
eukprot:TRINITY_DN145_c0_g1_i1.p1 TRINITY_DN145_c0_g1~~TRINITY_DN145_c0_g1_i1.p1  ORF type:complete len:287 (-),score=-5.62 TRINITY_DN145_c0_g1_i1:311-1078(-)